MGIATATVKPLKSFRCRLPNYADEDITRMCHRSFGDPNIWGHYLSDNEGVSFGITDEDIDLLQSNDILTLVIWNHTANITDYDHGQNEAKEAINLTKDHDIPEDVT